MNSRVIRAALHSRLKWTGSTFGNKGKEHGGSAIIQIGLRHPLWEAAGAAALFQ
ncbi:unnamed protein product [Rangifer tarandus platyrhynchus]|uniref:Uncharacterized protein n=1 Tax=Rangifer tarandus platyrhynchus TaxID=3082113 RepID=A0ACB1MKF1_RANTA